MSYITEIAVSINDDQEQGLRKKGFNKIYVDLNEGAGGNYIFLWYKKGSSNPITRLQVTFTDDMQIGLRNAGYHQVDKDLNAGAGGDYIHLWYYKGTTEYDNPIVDLKVTKDAEDEALFYQKGWERLACDLNRKAKGKWIRVWVKKEKKMYIADIKATTSFAFDHEYFSQGYTRVDEDVSRGGGGAFVFLWYRQSLTQSQWINHLDVSTNCKEEQNLEEQSYTCVGVNLNDGTEGNKKIHAWYKKGSDHPIQTITVIFEHEVSPYEKAGIQVIRKDLNTGNKGDYLYLAYP
ncbi:uncharacterized protein LOC109616528 [Esox lucius]|uniref:uncharacterized protein LOC109616528 n=1 Tax=Esox lucius TaxID=8010 RepID=UPI001476EE2D|nr:uncharacterized protein LOC109616528 [Esox lucius]